MNTPTMQDIRAAVKGLPPEGLTESGIARMTDLNAALKASGFKRITAAERDQAMNLGDLEDAPADVVRIVAEDSPSNPITLYVHGVGNYRFRIGEEVELPVEALAVLDDANITYTKI